MKTLVQNCVIARLDYCNSLYNGINMKSIKRLQRAQNTAARLISGTNIRDSISPVLRDLHWLPVNKRCQYKIMVLIYNALHGQAPAYINDMINWYHPRRPLRSANVPSLTPRKHRTIRFGKRLCDTAAATIWNSLPSELKCVTSVITFKKQLKTYLF